jgi:hypothetical protein
VTAKRFLRPNTPRCSGPTLAQKFAVNDLIVVEAGGARLPFDLAYPVSGSEITSDLAIAIGAGTHDAGCIKVDSHQRTSVAQLYAIVIGLDQISHAMGDGGVAAARIRNDLAEIESLLRHALRKPILVSRRIGQPTTGELCRLDNVLIACPRQASHIPPHWSAMIEFRLARWR